MSVGLQDGNHTTNWLILYMDVTFIMHNGFSSHILDVARYHFGNALWFYLLECEVMENFMYEFEWLKNEKFVFT